MRRALERAKYRDNPGPKKILLRRYRRKNAKRLAAYAKAARDAERAKGPPSRIDRLYWREKQRRLRSDPAVRARERQQKRDRRAKKNPRHLEVAA